MKTVSVKIDAQEKASRTEWLVRFVYWIPLAIVLCFLQIIACIGIVVNFFTSIILGKRIAGLNKFVNSYIAYSTKFTAYLYLTDERPPIMPEDL